MVLLGLLWFSLVLGTLLLAATGGRVEYGYGTARVLSLPAPRPPAHRGRTAASCRAPPRRFPQGGAPAAPPGAPRQSLL